MPYLSFLCCWTELEDHCSWRETFHQLRSLLEGGDFLSPIEAGSCPIHQRLVELTHGIFKETAPLLNLEQSNDLIFLCWVYCPWRYLVFMLPGASLTFSEPRWYGLQRHFLLQGLIVAEAIRGYLEGIAAALPPLAILNAWSCQLAALRLVGKHSRHLRVELLSSVPCISLWVALAHWLTHFFDCLFL